MFRVLDFYGFVQKEVTLPTKNSFKINRLNFGLRRRYNCLSGGGKDFNNFNMRAASYTNGVIGKDNSNDYDSDD